MIKHLRIDNRLIHGQVAVTWMNHIGANAIIVCNDKVAIDPMQKLALPLAARGSKVLVYSINDTIKYTRDHPNETLFVICKHPSDALALIEAELEILYVNVGNAAPVAGTKYKMVTKSIAVTSKDVEVYRKIASLRNGVLKSRTVPTSEEVDFMKILSEAGV